MAKVSGSLSIVIIHVTHTRANEGHHDSFIRARGAGVRITITVLCSEHAKPEKPSTRCRGGRW